MLGEILLSFTFQLTFMPQRHNKRDNYPTRRNLMQETRERLLPLVEIYLGLDRAEITDATQISGESIDSLEYLEMIMTIEEHFGVDLKDDALEAVSTFGQLVEVVHAAR